MSTHHEPIFQIVREVYLHRGINNSSKKQQQALFDTVGINNIIMVPDEKLGVRHDTVKGFGEDFVTVKAYGRAKRYRADQCIFIGNTDEPGEHINADKQFSELLAEAC